MEACANCCSSLGYTDGKQSSSDSKVLRKAEPGDILELWSSPYEELGGFVISGLANPDVYKGIADATATRCH